MSPGTCHAAGLRPQGGSRSAALGLLGRGGEGLLTLPYGLSKDGRFPPNMQGMKQIVIQHHLCYSRFSANRMSAVRQEGSPFLPISHSLQQIFIECLLPWSRYSAGLWAHGQKTRQRRFLSSWILNFIREKNTISMCVWRVACGSARGQGRPLGRRRRWEPVWVAEKGGMSRAHTWRKAIRRMAAGLGLLQ